MEEEETALTKREQVDGSYEDGGVIALVTFGSNKEAEVEDCTELTPFFLSDGKKIALGIEGVFALQISVDKF